MHITLTTLLVILSLVMWLKIIEIIFHMVRYYPPADHPLDLNPNREWPVTAAIARMRFIIPHFLRPLVFRFKVLVFLLVLCTPFAAPGKVALFAGLTLYAAIWIQLIRIIIDQLKYGSAHYLSGTAVPNPLFERKFGGTSAKQRLRAFLYLFLGLCSTVVFGFATLYYLYFVEHGHDGFNGLPPNTPWAFFHLLYFSVVTIATVGYGDISPVQHLIPRFLVASEILAGFLILVVLVTSVSLTFQKEAEHPT
jgi:hypothetical protein